MPHFAGNTNPGCGTGGGAITGPTATTHRRSQPGAKRRGERGSADSTVIGCLNLALRAVVRRRRALRLVVLKLGVGLARPRRDLHRRRERNLRATGKQDDGKASEWTVQEHHNCFLG